MVSFVFYTGSGMFSTLSSAATPVLANAWYSAMGRGSTCNVEGCAE